MVIDIPIVLSEGSVAKRQTEFEVEEGSIGKEINKLLWLIFRTYYGKQISFYIMYTLPVWGYQKLFPINDLVIPSSIVIR